MKVKKNVQYFTLKVVWQFNLLLMPYWFSAYLNIVEILQKYSWNFSKEKQFTLSQKKRKEVDELYHVHIPI